MTKDAVIEEEAVIKDEDKNDQGDAGPVVCDSKAGGGQSSSSFPNHINQRAIEARGMTEKNEADPPPRLP